MTATTNRHPDDGRIRIAYVMRAEERGGVEEHVLSLVKGIDQLRFDPYVVASPRLLELFGEELTATGAKLLPLRISGFSDFRSMLDFCRFLRHNHIDIVNTHMFIASLYYSPLARIAGVPVLLETSHGVEKWRLDKGFVKRHSFVVDRVVSTLQNCILAVSHACRNDLVSVKKIPPNKIAVVQNGRDLETFTPLPVDRWRELRAVYNISDDDFVFGVMARLDFQKGHIYLFDAIRLLLEQRREFKVLVIGDGALREELKQKVLDLGIGSHVLFTGFQKDLQGFHGILDVNLLPSLFEGLPLGLIEASAMERPVIATRVDGTPEVILDGETGVLVPPRNPQLLAEAMMYALDHKAHMAEMGKKGRIFALKQFTLDRQIHETEELYQALFDDCSR